MVRTRFRRTRLEIGEIRHARRGGGFTLIELIAVIVILAVLAGVAVPSLDSIDNTRAAMAAHQVRRDLSYLRQRAVATGVRCWAVIDTEAGKYTLLEEDAGNPGLTNAEPLVDPATGRERTTVFGGSDFVGIELIDVDFDGGPAIGFDWLGRPLNDAETSLAAPGSVTLTGGHQITVEPETGLVRHLQQ